MIQEDYVTFEQAKLLKHKGFPQGTLTLENCYGISGHNPDIYELTEYHGFCYYKPTISIVQKWLREKYNIIIQPTLYNQCYPIEYEDIIYYSDDKHYFDKTFGGVYNTYEEALSKGINKALELI